MAGTKKKAAKPSNAITAAVLQKELSEFKKQTLRVLANISKQQNQHETRIENCERNDMDLRTKCSHNQKAAERLTENYRHTNNRLTEHENSGRHVIPRNSAYPAIELSEDA